MKNHETLAELIRNLKRNPNVSKIEDTVLAVVCIIVFVIIPWS